MAVTSPTDSPLASIGVKTCKHGHALLPENTFRVLHKNGRFYDRCKRCRADGVARVRARQQGGALPVQTSRNRGEPEPGPGFHRREVFALLPSALRQRVAGYRLDTDPPDPLLAAVIIRASRTKVWAGMSAAFATIVLVEALIEESRESRSPNLRLDRLLAALLT
jgi:hypothetical protein